MGVLVPTAVAADALGVTPDAIRVLRHRGKLTRHGTKQRALVDVDELAALAAERQGLTEPDAGGTPADPSPPPDARAAHTSTPPQPRPRPVRNGHGAQPATRP